MALPDKRSSVAWHERRGILLVRERESWHWKIDHDPTNIKETLHKHLHHHKFDSPWISFTDSFVATIARALSFRHSGIPTGDIKIHIIDTTNIKNRALPIHAFTGALGYEALHEGNSPLAKMVLGSLPGEYLFWNELKVEASMVSLTALLAPTPLQPLQHFQGLLDLMPALERRSKGLKKLKKPKKSDSDTLLEWDIRNPPIKAWKLLKEFFDVELKIRNPKRGQTTRSGRAVEWYTFDDPKRHTDEIGADVLGNFQVLVKEFKPDFQIPVLIALLTMQTKQYHFEGIVEEMCKVYGGKSPLELSGFKLTVHRHTPSRAFLVCVN